MRGNDALARRLAFLLAACIAAGCSGGEPGAPTAAPTSAAPIPSATPTPVSTVLVRDDFADATSGWPTLDTEDALVAYLDGAYQVDVRKPGVIVATPDVAALPTDLADVRVDAVVRFTTEDLLDNVGIVCRASGSALFSGLEELVPDERHYSFSVFPDGSYRIRRQEGDSLVDLALGRSDAIRPAPRRNRVRIECVGDRLTLRVNRRTVVETHDDALASGAVGLRVASGRQVATGRATFDDVVVSRIDLVGPEVPPTAQPSPIAPPSTEPSLTATPTEVPTTTALPTEPTTTPPTEPTTEPPTEPSASPSQPTGEVVLLDDFSDAATGWLGGDTRDEDAWSSAEYVDGSLRLVVSGRRAARMVDSAEVVGFDGAPLDALGDVSVEVDASVIGTPAEWDVGLHCRRTSDTSYYYLGIRESGEGLIVKVTGRGTGEVLASAQRSFVRTAEATSNRLRAECVGDRLELWVNDRLAVRANDGDYATGRVAMEAGATDAVPLDVVFDNLTLRTR